MHGSSFTPGADMRKGADKETLSAEILMESRNFMLRALNLFLICFLNRKYYGTCTHCAHNVNSNALLNIIRGIVINKQSIIAEMENTKFAEI